GEAGPKQYAKIGRHSVLATTLNAFQDCPLIEGIQVVIHEDDTDLYHAALSRIEKLEPAVIGGATRQSSVLSGLAAIPEATHVLIHDAARPFVRTDLIETICTALQTNAAVVPAVAVTDSLRRVEDGKSSAVSRQGLFSVQTPQGFRSADIQDAHDRAEKVGRNDFTDDASLAEWAGLDVTLVSGDPANMKLTTPADMASASASKVPDVRVGHGYDTHQLVAGDGVILCGVTIPHNRRLDGHSDADVGLHALTDALLATIGAGDIGDHFPPTDPQWRGAKSDQFLAHAAELVRGRGGTITHMDVTLLCESPKIGPHRQAMREMMAKIVGIDVDRVSVKATTNERVGFIGREEGIVALATATVVLP
ncbi:MAG: bifunctional 2-C-methyl-D-erythritol 4-phosphate cytidylyltransferase/2-C-methyl-D-erythritol 2,4-cyclodiphosphate synthase, partial [Pseudomonadota bacterium]